MAQSASGSASSQDEQVAEVTVTNAETPEVTPAAREEMASKLVERFALWSGGAGLIPIPVVDALAVGGLQLQLLRRLSQIYDVPFARKSRQGSDCEHSRSDDSGNERYRGCKFAEVYTDPGNARRRVCDADALRGRHLCARQSIYPAFQIRGHAARFQPSRLSRIYQGAEGNVGFAITPQGFSSGRDQR